MYVLHIIYKLQKGNKSHLWFWGRVFLKDEKRWSLYATFPSVWKPAVKQMQQKQMNCIPYSKHHFSSSFSKYSNLGHLDYNSFAPKKNNLHDDILKNIIEGDLWDLHELFLRLEEELGSPHVVSLVTDYNVMPVRESCLFRTHQRGLKLFESNSHWV